MQVIEEDNKDAQSGRRTALAYQFHRVFDHSTTQELMFRDSGVKHLIDSAVKGYSATIFAYGPTGSGKTFSIAGVPEKVAKKRRHEDITVESTDGLIVRSIAYLFEAVRADASKFQVRASCLEIYNETVIDLLDKKGEALAVRVPKRNLPGVLSVK